MRLSAEAPHLLQKRLQQALQPVEVVTGATLSTLAFAAVYACCCFGLRFQDPGAAALGVVACGAACLGSGLMAMLNYRSHRPSRGWIALTPCLALAVAAGCALGHRCWWRHMVRYYGWREMASYVNVDPALDRGQSFMDAGTVYFKDGASVLRSRAVAFRNGVNYCAAPIVRGSVEYEANAGQLQTVSGFVLPRSGTVDWWAVGTDCCGASGERFDCGDVGSPFARAGLRLLEEASRPMYLLAVQEWSATTGLPVRHPVFFEWVRDPVAHADGLQSRASTLFYARLPAFFFLSLLLSLALHALLQRCRVQ